MKYKFFRDIVVKPCDKIMITKEVTEQIPNGKQDENGYNLYDTKTETKDVESDWAKGEVVYVPEFEDVSGNMKKIFPVNEGDIIVYPTKAAKAFELDDTVKLVSPTHIFAVESK